MITKIRLQNWKSFKDSTIYIDSLGILIGTNASGKSNVLDAFAFLRAVGDGKSLLDTIQTVTRDEYGDSHVKLLEEKENLAKLMASGTLGRIMINGKI